MRDVRRAMNFSANLFLSCGVIILFLLCSTAEGGVVVVVASAFLNSVEVSCGVFGFELRNFNRLILNPLAEPLRVDNPIRLRYKRN